MIARCFGGTLDGRWQEVGKYGRKFLAPVMDYGYKAMTFDDPDYAQSPLRVHEYTLQTFAVGYRRAHQPIRFYALIGPGFTVKMVAAWLDGWIEEADKLTKEAKMQTRPGDKARAEVAELERRIRNQMGYIDELCAERDEAEKLLRREQYAVKCLTTSRNNARAEVEDARRERDEAIQAAEHDRLTLDASSARWQRENRILRAERDKARERCNEVVRVARRFQRTLAPGGWMSRRVERIIDAAFGR